MFVYMINMLLAHSPCTQQFSHAFSMDHVGFTQHRHVSLTWAAVLGVIVADAGSVDVHFIDGVVIFTVDTAVLFLNVIT